MAWMMSAMDLQYDGDKTNGFQANQMAIRYYLMHADLHQIKTSLLIDNDDYALFRESLLALTTEQAEAQSKKAVQFVDMSIDL